MQLIDIESLEPFLIISKNILLALYRLRLDAVLEMFNIHVEHKSDTTVPA